MCVDVFDWTSRSCNQSLQSVLIQFHEYIIFIVDYNTIMYLLLTTLTK
jgi:hypothetical protein